MGMSFLTVLIALFASCSSCKDSTSCLPCDTVVSLVSQRDTTENHSREK